MNDQDGYLFSTQVPAGLSPSLLKALTRHSTANDSVAIVELEPRLDGYLATVREVAKINCFVNLKLAEAIYERLQRIVAHRDSISSDRQAWCVGAICYFLADDDEEPDFASPVGFEDDAEVLNAVLRFVGKPDWCIRPEDFDNA
ncbi:MAG: hypothetical protein WCT04_06340 [Planctomycetota bacterium]